MAAIIQYDLFEARPTEIEELRIELAAVKESNGKVRRGIYAKHGELAKLYIELHNRLDILERHICKS